MSDAAKPGLNDEQWWNAESILLRFDKAAAELGQVDLADFLDGARDEQRRYLLLELIKIDLEHRWNRGQEVGLDFYARQFPELKQGESLPAELIGAEQEIRRHFRASDAADPTKSHLAEQSPEFDITGRSSTSSSSQSDSSECLGRYQLKGEIGSGAFSSVYRAWDPQLKREVAIKLPHRKLMQIPETRERTLREAQAIAQLQHPAIVPVYEIGEANGSLFIVSELVEGATLQRHFTQAGTSVSQAADWVARIADALDYSHQCGIVHRDIKPDNVMIRPDGSPVVMDFGLAFYAASEATLTRHGDLLGTPAFMSPEQARGDTQKNDARSDVYSIGVMFYQLLTARLPFTGQTANVLHQVIHDEPPRPTQIDPSVPVDLETICLKAMAKEPQRRFNSAREMAEELRRWLRHEPIVSRPVGTLERFRMWSRRQPALAATLALSLILIAAVAWFAHHRVVRERNRFRAQRDRATASLYRSLLSDSRSQAQAKDTGWWWKALDNIRTAAQLEVPGRDERQLRNLALDIMSSEQPCFRLDKTWKPADAGIRQLLATPDGSRLITCDDRGALRVLDSRSGVIVAAADAKVRISRIALHPHGDWILGGTESGDLRTWQLPDETSDCPPMPSRKIALPFSAAELDAISFAPDGRRAALAIGKTIYLVRVADGTLHPEGELREHQLAVRCLTWSRDGNVLASGGMDKRLCLWNAATKKLIQSWNTVDPPRIVHMMEQGTKIAWADRESYTYDILHTLGGSIDHQPLSHAGPVQLLEHTRWGWLTGSSDGSVILWQGGKRAAVARGAFAAVRSGCWSPEQDALFVGHGDGKIRKWDLSDSPYRFSYHAGHRSAFYPQKHRLVTGVGLVDVTEAGGTDLAMAVPAFSSADWFEGDSRYVCGDSHGFVRLHSRDASQPDANKRLHPAAVTSIKISSDEKVILSGSRDGSLCLSNAIDLSPIKNWKSELGPIFQVAIDVDRRICAACGRLGIKVWRLGTSTVLWKREHYLLAGCLAFDKRRMAVPLEDGRIELRGLDTFSAGPTLPGHSRPVTALSFSDGKLFSAGHDGLIRIWSATGDETSQLALRGAPPGWIACHAERKLVAAGGRGATSFWRMSRREPLAIIRNSGQGQGAFNSDGSQYNEASRLGYVTFLPLSDIVGQKGDESRNDRPLFSHDNLHLEGNHMQQVWDVAVSPDGKWLATAGHDRRAKIWNAKTLQLVHTMKSPHDIIWSVAFSPDSQRLLTGSSFKDAGEIRIWDVKSGKQMRRINGHRGLVRRIAFHPAGSCFASASSDGSVILWTPTGELIGTLYDASQPIYDLDFSPQGKWLAAACSEHHVAVWDSSRWSFPGTDPRVVEAPRTLQLESGQAWAVRFSPDGMYLGCGSEIGLVTLWRASDFARIATINSGRRRIRSISFSHDSHFLAAGMFDLRSVVWNLKKMREELDRMKLNW